MFDSRLNYAVMVARSGSFTAAARTLGLTQPAVTKSVADLEKELGYAIFYRTARGVILTENGRDFIDRVTRLLEDARNIFKSSAERSNPFAGKLRIGIAPASLEWRLTEPVVSLLKRHPTIRYHVSAANFETIVQQLRSGSIDVAIGFDAAFSEWADLRRVPMGELKTTLFVRRDHPILERRPIEISDLADFDFISPSDSRPYGEVIRNFYESRDLDWQLHVHIADYFPMVRRIVANSNAIAVADLGYSNTKEFSARFVALPDLQPWPPSPLCCAVRARWEPRPAVRAFIADISRTIPREP